MRAQGKLSSICLALSFRDWIPRASFHPSPALVDVREVLLWVAYPPWVSHPWGQDLMLAELCISAAPGSSSPPCPVSRPAAIKAVLNWGQGVFFSSPCGKSALENLRAFQDLPGALLMNPSLCHIFHHKPRMKPQKSAERHFCCSRDSKNVHMQMCLAFASILEPKVASCLPFSG